MLKIFMPSPHEDWVNDITIAEFTRHTKHKIVYDIRDADLIWFYAKWIANHFPQDIVRSKPVITTWHHVTPNKFNRADFDFLRSISNVFHVPNVRTREFLHSQGMDRKMHILPYWINDNVFFPAPTIREEFRKRLPNKFIIGSFQRDTEGSDLKTPKLEKGPDILGDILQRLDPAKYHVLLGGWRRQYIISRLDSMKMGYSYFERYSDINALYNACDLYVVSSRHEGGPQSLIEAPATRTPIISTRMGIADVILEDACIYDSVEHAVNLIESRLPNEHVETHFLRVQDYRMADVIQKYDEFAEWTYDQYT